MFCLMMVTFCRNVHVYLQSFASVLSPLRDSGFTEHSKRRIPQHGHGSQPTSLSWNRHWSHFRSGFVRTFRVKPPYYLFIMYRHRYSN